jgi:hypothetical protein
MSKAIQYFKDGEGIYAVISYMPAQVNGYIGRVARVGDNGPWVAAPKGLGINGPHLAFKTRGQAALALEAFVNDNNPAWIYPADDDPRLAKYNH